MPQMSHAAFEYELTDQHGTPPTLPGQRLEISGASDRVSLGLHAGTHIDSLAHVAYQGRLFDGTEFASPGVQSRTTGLHPRTGTGLFPIIAPAILLDFTDYLKAPVIPADYAISADRLVACANHCGVTINAGDVVLIRTGWDTLWADPEQYFSGGSPGLTLDAARLLAESGIRATGSDTAPFELAPDDDPMAVHVELLVRARIPILESLDLRELSRSGAYRMGFIAVPLPMPHATGSPVDPLALIDHGSAGDSPARG